MTNDIAVPTINDVVKANEDLTEIEQLIAQEQESEEMAFELLPTRIKIAPGGIGVFATDDSETFELFDAVPIISQIARAYWSEPATGKRPMCSSPDGLVGYYNEESDDEQVRAAMHAKRPHAAIRLQDAGQALPESFSCADCPLNDWNSIHQGGKTGRGKACKELRRLVVMVKGWTAPALLTLPPTSLKVWDRYCTALARKKSAYFANWATMTLDADRSKEGDAYSVLSVRVGAALTADELKTVIEVRAEYQDLVRGLEIGGDEYTVTEDMVDGVVDGSASPTKEDIPF